MSETAFIENDTITVNNPKELEQIVDELLNYKDVFRKSIARSVVQDEVFSILRMIKRPNSTMDMPADYIIYNLNQLCTQNWDVWGVLQGAELVSDSPLQLGPYTLYSYPRDETLMREMYKNILSRNANPDQWWDMTWGFLNHQRQNVTLVRTQVNSKGSETAQKSGRPLFDKFANTLRFMMGGYLGHQDIGVFDFRSNQHISIVALADDISSVAHQLTGASVPVPLDGHYFRNSNFGFNRIWSFLCKTKPNDMERRLLAAIDWAGKASRDPDLSKALVQSVFGLEALLQLQVKNTVVTPGILQQVAESCAFILESDLENRKKIFNRVKDIYSKRSAIAHGGNTSLEEQDIGDSLAILRAVVITILTKDDFKTFQSINDLKAWVDNNKFR